MKIGINGFEAVIPRFGFDSNGLPNRVGSSEVCFQILCHLAKIDKTNDYTVYLPAEPTSDMPRISDTWHYKIIPNRRLWTISGLTLELLKRPKLDIFFSPTHYGPLFTPCPEVISILDVSYKHFPDMFNKKDLLQLATWGKYSLSRASKIITISHSSKDDIIKEYHVNPEKISVVYPGLKFQEPLLRQGYAGQASTKSQTNDKFKMINFKTIQEKYNISESYLLFVGTLQPRKNIKRLIEAFARIVANTKLIKANDELQLVIVGRRGWQYEDILDAPRNFGVENQVKFLETVSDEELPLFYKNAQAFVLPSLYEGFGLPVLEAMKYGCPVATSNVSSLPEAGGDAAIYFDPENVEDIAAKIEKVLSSGELRSKMVKRGFEQIKKFSWEKSAREVLEVLESVVNRLR